MRIRGMADLVSGLIFMAIAGLAWLSLAGVPAGTAVRMGPAYFPLLLAGCLGGFGVILVGRGLVRAGDAAAAPPLRATLAVLGAVLLFSLTIDRIGLVAVSVMTVILVCLAAPPVRVLETVALAIGLAIGVTVVFSFLLGLSIPVWPWSI